MKKLFTQIQSSWFYKASVSILGTLLVLVPFHFIISNNTIRARSNLRDSFQMSANIAMSRIEDQLETAKAITETLDLLIENEEHHQVNDFGTTASKLLRQNENISSLQLAPNGVVETNYPAAGNEQGYIDLFADPARSPYVTYARDNDAGIIQGPFPLAQGGMAMALCDPVFVKTAEDAYKFWGFTIAIIKVPDIFETAFDRLNREKAHYNLYQADPISPDTYKTVFSSYEEETKIEDPAFAEFSFLSAKWRLEILPSTGWNAHFFIDLTIVVALISLFVGALILTLTLLREQRRKVALLSLTDGLTQAGNVRSFQHTTDDYFKRGKKCGIFYVDLNFFKEINDFYGHEVGDAVLREMATRLKFATEYPIYRLGGDEFALFVDKEADQEEYDRINSILLSLGEEAIEVGEHSIRVSLAVGYARFPKDGESKEDIIKAADKRMYQSKTVCHAKRK